MGRLIDADEVSKYVIIGNGDLQKCPTVEAIPKDQYEARLKADMVAMLEKLKKEIEDLYFPQTNPQYMEGRSDCLVEIKEDIIQQKIDALKEVEE